MPIMEIDPSSETGELERKRENRLTNIVDQLLHNRATQSRSEEAKLDRGSHADDEKSVTISKLDNKTRNRKRAAQQRAEIVKDERCSPDQLETGASSRIASPQTPSPNSSLRTSSSFAGTPPVSAAAYSPSMMDGLHMSRNYSDFMRSLAAKYNNSTSGADYHARFDSPRLFPKGSIVGPDPAGSSASAAMSALAAFPQFAAFKEAQDDAKRDAPAFVLPALIDAHALPGFPMMDMSSTQALLNIVRSSRNAQHIDSYLRGTSASAAAAPAAAAAARSRPADAAVAHSPLDLSAAPVKRAYPDAGGALAKSVDVDSLPAKKKYLQSEEKLRPNNKTAQFNCRSTCTADACTPGAVEVHAWSVNEVVDFVRGIDLCAEYAEVFREHSIDGSTLPLLTEDHLTSGMMGMKLGPALKLRTALAKKIGHCAVCLHCAHCHGDVAASQAAQE